MIESHAARREGPGRLISFSDGVMAVIITIMAFNLQPPAAATWAAVGHRLPELLVYMLSFSFIGIYWNNHHHLLRATPRISGAVMWANLLLLFCLSLIPVLTRYVADEYHHSLPAALYGACALASALAYTLLVRTIMAANDPTSEVAVALGRDAKGLISLCIYALAIPLAFVSPWIAYGLYALVSVVWFVPDPRLSRSAHQ